MQGARYSAKCRKEDAVDECIAENGVEHALVEASDSFLTDRLLRQVPCACVALSALSLKARLYGIQRVAGGDLGNASLHDQIFPLQEPHTSESTRSEILEPLHQRIISGHARSCG